MPIIRVLVSELPLKKKVGCSVLPQLRLTLNSGGNPQYNRKLDLPGVRPNTKLVKKKLKPLSPIGAKKIEKISCRNRLDLLEGQTPILIKLLFILFI